jgi:transcriptional regulator with XRE-family HTH domain
LSLGKRLKTLREEKGITTREISKIFKLGKSTISNYENDIRKPDYDILIKLADFYEVTVDYLLGITDERNIYKLESNNLPKELREIGVEYIALAKEMQDKEISLEIARKIVEIVKHEDQ